MTREYYDENNRLHELLRQVRLTLEELVENEVDSFETRRSLEEVIEMLEQEEFD